MSLQAVRMSRERSGRSKGKMNEYALMTPSQMGVARLDAARVLVLSREKGRGRRTSRDEWARKRKGRRLGQRF
jgi:hypothetical protein